jgi:hypothetical protein
VLLAKIVEIIFFFKKKGLVTLFLIVQNFNKFEHEGKCGKLVVGTIFFFQKIRNLIFQKIGSF